VVSHSGRIDGRGSTDGLWCGSFLEGPKAALVASKDFEDGHYKTTPERGIRAFGRVYSAWAYGQTVSARGRCR
jgi:hypothetical protein